MGVLVHPSAQGLFLGSCGDRTRIGLKIIAGRILEARFMADGCGVTVACGVTLDSQSNLLVGTNPIFCH
jgi:NifU-like protein involved in Fe-S cluster formation